MQTWDNGWEIDSSIVLWSTAYFKNSYAFDIKYDNETEDTADDITPVIAQAEPETNIRFALAKAALVTVYYTYNYADSSSKGFSIDGKEYEWPAVSTEGEVAAKELGIMVMIPIAFAVSIDEPPPMVMIESAPQALNASTPSTTFSIVGFGLIPEYTV